MRYSRFSLLVSFFTHMMVAACSGQAAKQRRFLALRCIPGDAATDCRVRDDGDIYAITHPDCIRCYELKSYRWVVYCHRNNYAYEKKCHLSRKRNSTGRFSRRTWIYIYIYTVSQKRVLPKFVDRFSKILSLLERELNVKQKSHNIFTSSRLKKINNCHISKILISHNLAQFKHSIAILWFK